ncbi:hypothetical protein RP726_20315 [Candidatus Methylospira mobilis]|nr:hypothetical protein [Candidatus Methylospira mobilis]WNV04710.1 hypothetical protein RP726_20315 [Candidatus Methylospira mobilis]
MAHIHGIQKAVANGAAHGAMGHAAHGAMGHAAGHAAHEAMGHGMTHLVKAGMSHPASAVTVHHLAGGAAATGAAVVTAGSHTGKSIMSKIFHHPLVLFGLGVAVGYTVHKYRKEIILAANEAADKSKDFVLQQRENLEDILEEGKDKAV